VFLTSLEIKQTGLCFGQYTESISIHNGVVTFKSSLCGTTVISFVQVVWHS